MKLKHTKQTRFTSRLLMFLGFILLFIGIFPIGAAKAGPNSIFNPPPVFPNASTSPNSPTVPPRSECNSIRNATEAIKRQCRNEYSACNNLSGPNIGPAIERCKIKAINDAKVAANNSPSNPGGGGGGGAGAGAGGGAGGGGGGAGAGAGGAQQNEIVLGTQGTNQCGNLPDDEDNWKTKLNFGCLGKQAPSGLGPIQDLVFALIRFLSIGVGVILTLSIIAAGIQYTTSEGNAEATQAAKKRIQNSIIGLGVFIFAYTALQFLVPGGIFTGNWVIDPSFIIKGILP